MKAKYARQIRAGILLARQVARRERVGPRRTINANGMVKNLSLEERAYAREMTRLRKSFLKFRGDMERSADA